MKTSRALLTTALATTMLLCAGPAAPAAMVSYQNGQLDPFLGGTYTGTEDNTLLSDAGNTAKMDW